MLFPQLPPETRLREKKRIGKKKKKDRIIGTEDSIVCLLHCAVKTLTHAGFGKHADIHGTDWIGFT